MSRVTRAMDVLVESIPAAVYRAGLANNSCILSTRLGVEALRAQRIRARPQAVALRVMTPAYVEMLECDGEGRSAEEWRDAGAWSVWLGFGVPERKRPEGYVGYDGHVVAIVEERYVLDLTANQVRRHAQGIEAEPFWHEARDLARGKPALFGNDDGCRWLYEPRPDRSFVGLPAWSGYRVSVRNGMVISEPTRIRQNVPAAPEIRVALP